MVLTDQSKTVVLVILDLSAAFHTIYSKVHFPGRKNCLVFQTVCLAGLRPILKNVAKECQLRVLCQIPWLWDPTSLSSLFCVIHNIYKILGTTAQRYGVKYHLYADNT